jgi:tRNA dimethylallyltransferase
MLIPHCARQSSSTVVVCAFDKHINSPILTAIFFYFFSNSAQNSSVDFEEGMLQTIGFKEFVPYLEKYDKSHDALINRFVEAPESFGEEEPEGYKSLLKCLEELKLVTQRYSKRQLKWIKNRFLGSEQREVPDVFALDTSDVGKWSEAVYKPAEATVLAYTNDETVALKPLERLKRLGEGLDEETTHHCETCDRPFIGDFQWQLHLKSNKHKRRLAGMTKSKRLKKC